MAKRKSEWQNNYIAKTYDRVNLLLTKGKKTVLQAHAQNQGESLNGFVNRAIDEAVERDNALEPDGCAAARIVDRVDS
jgi:predicted HicB family RNase H-like nuclease